MRILFILLCLCWAIAPASTQCDEQGNVWQESWISCSKMSLPHDSTITGHWVMFDLGQAYRIDSLHIWNYNLDLGAISTKAFSLYSSYDSISWASLGTFEIEQTTGDSLYTGQGFLPSDTIPTRFLVINVDSTYTDTTCAGLSEVYLSLSDNNRVWEEPIVEKRYSTCDNLYSLELINKDSFDFWHWNDFSSSPSLDSLSSGKYSITVGDSISRFTYPIFIEAVDTSSLSWNVGTTIPGGEYIDDSSIETSGIIDEDNDVIFVVENGGELSSYFNIQNGGELSIFADDCEHLSSQVSLGYVSVSSNFTKNRITNHIGLGKRYNVTSTTSSDTSSGVELLTGVNQDKKIADAYRFLSQSTFGGNQEMAKEVAEMGYGEWIDWQSSVPYNSYFNHLYFVSRFNQANILYHTNFIRSWWHNILTGEEYLRDKVAYALSQIFVISSRSFLHNYGDGFVDYYDVLSKHALGNYRDLLYDVTLHPMMGFYLSHMNNPPTDSLNNIFPDENYAREILQLFSIGLHELNNDGTEKLDSLGDPIPTYDNKDVIEFAKVFTGLHRHDKAFGSPATLVNNRVTRSFMTKNLSMTDTVHDSSPKLLLNNDSIPAGLSGLEDINRAIDNIFNHPNVGPFVAIRLIQRLVKSSPTPAYVERITNVFNDDGTGIRGNLQAVVRAILLDEEARDCNWIDDPYHGKLKEPLLRFTQLYKALDLKSTTGTYYALGDPHEAGMQQAPLRAPSVFNFYTYDYTPPGELSDFNKAAPEFQIFNSSTSIGYVNTVDSLAFHGNVLDVQEGAVYFEFNDELPLANDHSALVDDLSLKLTYNQLSNRTKAIVINALDSYTGAMEIEKINLAVYLICSSPEFAILK